LSVSAIIETIGLQWRDLRGQLLDLLFPPRCVGCRRIGAWLCAECLSQIPRVEHPFCVRCGDRITAGDLCARCRTSPLQIERIRAVVYFEGPLREAIHHLKYKRHTELAKPLGHLMVTYWRQHPMPADVVVPVPLHPARLRERGYNQAALLARELAQQTGLVVEERTLTRERATAPQVELNAKQRRENVHDAFRCSEMGWPTGACHWSMTSAPRALR
jgi:predicted amidophosphoribosyltransferase